MTNLISGKEALIALGSGKEVEYKSRARQLVKYKSLNAEG